MAKWNAIESLHLTMLDDLRHDPSLNLISERHGEVGPGFAELEPLGIFDDEWSDIQLEPEMLNNSLRFEVAAHWESTPPLPRFAGEYRVPAPIEILGQDHGRWANMYSNPRHRRFITQLRAFDTAYSSGRHFSAFLHMDPSLARPDVWFYDLVGIETPHFPTGFVKLDLTFSEYLKVLTLSRGIYGWQYLFADISFGDPAINHLVTDLANGIDVLSVSELAQRLEARL